MTQLTSLTFLIFAYTTVEGLVVNMMYPSTVAFIVKDFAIAYAYMVLMSRQIGSTGTLRRVAGPLGVFAFVTIAFLAIPSQVSFVGEMVAIKQRLFYIPLAWLGYVVINSDEDFLGLARLMAISAIPACLFGIYLFFVGPIGLAQIGANYSAYIGSTAGEHGVSFWRVPGTFTSPGQYGGFLLIHSMLFAGVLFDPRVKGRLRTVTIISIVFVLAALLVSGSRSPLLLFMLCCVIMLVVTGRLHGIGMLGGGLYAVFTIAFTFFGDGVKDRVGSIASWEHVDRFKDTYFGQLFWQMLWQNPMGFGLGRATLGPRHFTEWTNIMLVESYFGIIVAETGLLGLTAFIVAALSVVTTLIRCHGIMRSAPNATLWYAVALPVITTAMLMPINTGIDSAPTNLYFWFFLGVALKLYDLEIWRRAGRPTAPVASALPPVVYPLSYQ